ncbi:MAG: hypothetical protein ACXVH4_02810 [Halobacteriota archaeon]
MNGIYLDPIVPGWVNDAILKVLLDSYDIKLVSTSNALYLRCWRIGLS